MPSVWCRRSTPLGGPFPRVLQNGLLSLVNPTTRIVRTPFSSIPMMMTSCPAPAPTSPTPVQTPALPPTATLARIWIAPTAMTTKRTFSPRSAYSCDHGSDRMVVPTGISSTRSSSNALPRRCAILVFRVIASSAHSVCWARRTYATSSMLSSLWIFFVWRQSNALHPACWAEALVWSAFSTVSLPGPMPLTPSIHSQCVSSDVRMWTCDCCLKYFGT
mmetsp:Transcript_12457/g.31589  ORF Transcript_12457/g.31589 Transcript_12457/m.31589 type:complete len:218 (-) Transcript_12457:1289-1942(-)